VNDAIRKEIMADSDADRIKQVAIDNGLATLRQDGWRKVKNGVTTIREVLRVTVEG
jgi:type II secretory ATPase GspE/PulE/Tfp pilus assembly ATPase PilB-like protein